jgi:hypothetical protein
MAESIFGPELLSDARPLVLPCRIRFRRADLDDVIAKTAILAIQDRSVLALNLGRSLSTVRKRASPRTMLGE